MDTINLENIDSLKQSIGKEFAVSEWLTISQADIDQFGITTGDNFWIHTDVTRATEDSPYGGTIAQGYLTLSLLNNFARQVIAKDNDRICINYGLNLVRFPAPVRSGQRVRAHLSLASIEKLNGGARVAWHGSVKIENSTKPACYAELISQWFNT